MKSFLSLCVVLAAAALISGAKLEEQTKDSSFQEIVPLRMLFRTTLFKPAIPNASQTDEVVFRGDGRTRIRAINQQEVGPSQGIQVGKISGGIGETHVTLRVTSSRGRGYHLIIEIWA